MGLKCVMFDLPKLTLTSHHFRPFFWIWVYFHLHISQAGCIYQITQFLARGNSSLCFLRWSHRWYYQKYYHHHDYFGGDAVYRQSEWDDFQELSTWTGLFHNPIFLLPSSPGDTLGSGRFRRPLPEWKLLQTELGLSCDRFGLSCDRPTGGTYSRRFLSASWAKILNCSCFDMDSTLNVRSNSASSTSWRGVIFVPFYIGLQFRVKLRRFGLSCDRSGIPFFTRTPVANCPSFTSCRKSSRASSKAPSSSTSAFPCISSSSAYGTLPSSSSSYSSRTRSNLGTISGSIVTVMGSIVQVWVTCHRDR